MYLQSSCTVWEKWKCCIPQIVFHQPAKECPPPLHIPRMDIFANKPWLSEISKDFLNNILHTETHQQQHAYRSTISASMKNMQNEMCTKCVHSFAAVWLAPTLPLCPPNEPASSCTCTSVHLQAILPFLSASVVSGFVPQVLCLLICLLHNSFFTPSAS